jgi:hypothetical protein
VRTIGGSVGAQVSGAVVTATPAPAAPPPR